MAKRYGIVTDLIGLIEILSANVADGTFLTRSGSAWVGVPPSGVGVILQGETWAFDSLTGDGDPGSGVFRLNNANFTLVTQAFINNITENSAPNGENVMGEAAAGDYLYIEQHDAPIRWKLYSVTGVTIDGSGYQKVQLAHVQGGVSLQTTKKCILRLFKAQGGGGGPTLALDADVQTTTAAVTTIDSHTTPASDQGLQLKGSIIAKDAAERVMVWEFSLLAVREVGGGLLIASFEVLNGPQHSEPMPPWTISADVNTDDVDFKVRGEAGVTIEWSIEGTVHET